MVDDENGTYVPKNSNTSDGIYQVQPLHLKNVRMCWEKVKLQWATYHQWVGTHRFHDLLVESDMNGSIDGHDGGYLSQTEQEADSTHRKA